MKKLIKITLSFLLGFTVLTMDLQANNNDSGYNLNVTEKVVARAGDYVTKRFHLESTYTVNEKDDLTFIIEGSVTYNYKTGEIESYMENFDYNFKPTDNGWTMLGTIDDKSKLTSNSTTIVYMGNLVVGKKNVYGDLVKSYIPYTFTYTPAAE